MRSRVFEFREKELILTTGFIPIPVKLPYADIVSVQRTNYFAALSRNFNIAKPVINLPLGVSWNCALIEMKKVAYSVMLNKCDEFVAELNARIEQSKLI
jgi:hypothetical protein